MYFVQVNLTICFLIKLTILQVVSGLLLVPLSIALCVLFGWHIYLILHNKTTIEVIRCFQLKLLFYLTRLISTFSIKQLCWQYHEGVRALWLAEKGGSLYNHPYDLGPYENLQSVRTKTILLLPFFLVSSLVFSPTLLFSFSALCSFGQF